MSQPERIEVFNHHLDELLSGAEPDPNALPDTDLQALEIANRLAALDLSVESKQRYALRRKLIVSARQPNRPSIWRPWRLPLKPAAALAIAVPGATLLFVWIFVLGWTFTNLGRPPASNGQVSATAFAISRTSIESGLPPLTDDRTAQAFVPQPLPTPIAPRQLTTNTPPAENVNQVPLLTSQRTNPLGVTHVTP